ncbi:HdaA/DnaA family protein [Candidatus Kinetoplastidibacterium galati]|uniref:DnaA-like protein n=1 Tax=Candidatus Kinetoplastidibacterium galati TCC219 TaxID=1208921 RepID=M1MBS9_9PROT|nr:DnaA/Hda family protein [Candidatus Kinetoplastibacterium galatii]AGF49260.1 DnaA-like protein [Candidatus Kinetoplastibacterium galatii TCC219]
MRRHQLLLNVSPILEPTIENYVVGLNDEALYSAMYLPTGRAIYFWGPDGCGRTHLLRALSNKDKAIYINNNQLDAIINKLYRDDVDDLPNLITIDDVHLLNSSQQSKVFKLYNTWRELSLTKKSFSMILSGNQPPISLKIREDLRTRLGWDLVFKLEPLSDQDKTNVLKKLSGKLGIFGIDNVITWMIHHHERDMRKLTATLIALDRYSLSTKRPITIPLLKEMIGNLEF